MLDCGAGFCLSREKEGGMSGYFGQKRILAGHRSQWKCWRSRQNVTSVHSYRHSVKCKPRSTSILLLVSPTLESKSVLCRSRLNRNANTLNKAIRSN